MTDELKVSRADGICELRIDRLARRNALTGAIYAALADAMDEASSDPAIRVVLLTGGESAFTAGNDLADFLRDPPRDFDAPVHRFLRARAGFPKPLIAAVCGPAIGIGTTMLLHCDLVYAAEDATLSLPFVNLGLCPEAASSLLLPQVAGYQRAAELLLLGEPFGAGQARDIGLVNAVLPAPQVLEHARAQAKKLVSRPLASLLATKALMKRPLIDGIRETMHQEGETFGRMLAEPAAREAFSAFLEKRPADFSKCR
jgi:enoyl-CoA hydratase/carnithine racemase